MPLKNMRFKTVPITVPISFLQKMWTKPKIFIPKTKIKGILKQEFDIDKYDTSLNVKKNW